MNFNKFAETLTDAECAVCISDYERFTKAGMIGECTLRSKAAEYAEMLADIPNTKWMEMLANHCHRRFALRYITDNGMTASDDGLIGGDQMMDDEPEYDIYGD